VSSQALELIRKGKFKKQNPEYVPLGTPQEEVTNG
jgi:hypothetical protein